MNDTNGIGALAPRLPELGSSAESSKKSGLDFAELMGKLLNETNRHLTQAEDQAQLLAEGEAGIVETVLALNKADLSLRHVVEMRNRMLDAYEKLMRMQV